MNQKYIDQTSSARVPDGMMATRKMKLSVYRQLTHDPLMEDAVEPISFDAQSKKVLRALLIKDGVRSVMDAVLKIILHQEKMNGNRINHPLKILLGMVPSSSAYDVMVVV